MPRLARLFSVVLTAAAVARAADAPATASPSAAALAAEARRREVTDILERLVTWLHDFFPGVDNVVFHWIACGILFASAILLRRIITNVVFHYLKKLASKTETTLDDKLFPALERPTAALVMATGIYASLTVLQLSEQMDRWVGTGAKMAVLGVVLWGLLRAGGAILDHLEEIAHAKEMTVATFMPLIKKTLLVFAVVFGVLVIAQSLGWPVQSFIAGLGIGGLAFALAAQDTIANMFGSLVVVIDQPFKVGDNVKIGANTGTVEDIGMRSTKIRLLDKSLVIIPNKTVAAEAITNLTRFTGRRTEQVLGLTYATRPEQLEPLLADLRALLAAEPEIDPASAHVYFRDFAASSMDVWLVYVVRSPDFAGYMRLRQRLNLAFLRAIEARGLALAFPTQTLHLDGPVAQQLAAARN